MSPARPYPSEPAGPFERPPRSIIDGDGETIEIVTVASTENGREHLIEMYVEFDPADRAQGIPPVRREDIAEWLDLVLSEGPDVIALVDDRIVGHATLVPENGDGHELAIFVHQAYRRRGIGAALVRGLLAEAAAEGIGFVWLTVERWNHPAIALYEDVGFEPTSRGRFELEMSIRLAPSDG